VIVSTHPRTKQRLATHALGELSPLIRFLPPFGFTDYVRLQPAAYCVLSDSGTITEEASLLDLPAVTMRDAHERPEGMDAGTLVMARLDAEGLFAAIRTVRNGHRTERRFSGAVLDYQGGEVSTKVVRIVASYIDFVNRVVWSKPEGGLTTPPTATPQLYLEPPGTVQNPARCEEHRYARCNLRDTGMRSTDLLTMPDIVAGCVRSG
jgi:UDP-N-acetylglucosamine 2-epimerase